MFSKRHRALDGGSAGAPGVAGASRAFARIRADEALVESPLVSRKEGALWTSEVPRAYASLRADGRAARPPFPIPVNAGALRLNAGSRTYTARAAGAHKSRAVRVSALCADTARAGSLWPARAGSLWPRRLRPETNRGHKRTRATVPMTQR